MIVEVANGANKGLIVQLARITFESNKQGFTYYRRQFPVKAAFAMTINKSQGQTLDKVGGFLKSHVFTHGQLYVLVSRVGSSSGLKLVCDYDTSSKMKNGFFKTKNIVYQQALLQEDRIF